MNLERKNQMNKQKLIEKVKQWHVEKQTDDLEKQLLYLGAEFGEFVGAYLKNDHDGMVDGLGDTLVVLINIARLTGCEIDTEYKGIPLKGDIFEHISWNLREITALALKYAALQNLHSTKRINSIYFDLKVLAETLDLNIWDCLQYSYNIISEREGETIDGVFVKDGE